MKKASRVMTLILLFGVMLSGCFDNDAQSRTPEQVEADKKVLEGEFVKSEGKTY